MRRTTMTAVRSPLPPPPPPTGDRFRSAARVTAIVVASVLGTIAVAVAALACFVIWIVHGIAHPDRPGCDADPIPVSWSRDGGLRRSQPFVLAAGEVIQVDAEVHTDESVLFGTWSSIYIGRSELTSNAIFGGAPRPTASADPRATDATTTAADVRVLLVGTGRNAINEHVEVPAGEWQLVTDQHVGDTTVSIGC